MIDFKIFTFALPFIVFANGVGAEACKSREIKNQRIDVETGDQRVAENKSGQTAIKVLAEGQFSLVSEPFVAVARDAETYDKIRALITDLPTLDEMAFKTQIVIAAFMGERRTGGYSVAITRQPDGSVSVTGISPEPDAIVSQVITSPFKIVSVPTSNGDLRINLDQSWRDAARSYQLEQGTFDMTGGIAGRIESFELKGSIVVLRLGNLVTFAFDLNAAGAKANKRTLTDVATGTVGEDGRITVNRIEPGSLVDLPRSLLKASGRFLEEDGAFELHLETLPSYIADGYSGRGTLRATSSK